MKFGLEDSVITRICEVFAQFPQIQKVILYGSRAKGTFKNGSDIDLCLFSKEYTLSLLYKVEEALDDLLLPYTCDLCIYEQLNNNDLIAHIDRVGVFFYERAT